MNPNLYRLHEIHEIEKELHEEKLKYSAMIKKYHCLLNFCTGCLLIFQFCVFLLDVGFLSDFKEIIGTISGKVLYGLNLFFGSASIFLKGIEKILFNKIQRHEKLKTLIEMQLNNIIVMVSKALSDDEISEVEFENIFSQTRKRNVSHKKFDEVDLEIDKLMPKMLPKLVKKSESFVWNK